LNQRAVRTGLLVPEPVDATDARAGVNSKNLVPRGCDVLTEIIKIANGGVRIAELNLTIDHSLERPATLLSVWNIPGLEVLFDELEAAWAECSPLIIKREKLAPF
jgi:hypothetical protein